MSNEKEIEEFRNARAKDSLLDSQLDEKQRKLLEDISREAKMPIKLKDGDIELGEGELDIRELSKKSKDQLIFRQLVLNNVYLRQVVQSQVDLLRLVMIILKKMGVEDIIQATDDLQTELAESIKSETSEA